MAHVPICLYKNIYQNLFTCNLTVFKQIIFPNLDKKRNGTFTIFFIDFQNQHGMLADVQLNVHVSEVFFWCKPSHLIGW